MRDTSIEAYNRIKDEGLLSERRLQVYEILFENGPLTGNQLIKIAQKQYPMLNTGAFNTRLSELRNAGVVKELREIICPVTGYNVILWDVTSRLPIKVEKAIKHKCPTCNGSGYIKEQQLRFTHESLQTRKTPKY